MISAASRGVAAVERALSVLGAFRAADEALALAEIARRTGLYKSTALRLLGSLERFGYVRRLESGRYAVGPEPARLARLYQQSFRVGDVVVPVLRELAGASGETASYYVREGGSRVCLHRVEPARAVRVALYEGDRLPLEKGASGKVLRAFGARPDPALAAVRARMHATSFGERDPGAAAVACPVFGTMQELKGALALAGPRERFGAKRVGELTRLVREAAARVTA
ncbi:MAG: IclR family transcriptional regulator, partial [Burkholderiales bacterium]